MKARVTPIQERQRARRRALQALYQWQIKGQGESADALVRQFLEHQDFNGVDTAYFEGIVHGVLDAHEDFDSRLEGFMDRPMGEVDQMERAVLRLSAYELLRQPDVPARVAINEAVDLSHRFGAEQGHAYINGVLDKAARAWRAGEFTDSRD